MTELRSSGYEFCTPPVYETALAVQFDELASFKTVHFGLYHLTLQSFPAALDQPRLEPIRESFPMAPRQPFLKLVPSRPGPERVWFCNRPQDPSLLLQLQPDRFGLNWKRTSDEVDYVRFRQNGPVFLTEFRRFEQFCLAQGMEQPRPNLCEVVYVNHVVPQPGETVVECLEAILDGVSLKPRNDLPAPELVAFNRVYPIGENRGRLYAEAAIGHRHNQGDVVILKMTSRMVCRPGDDLAERLQAAHDALVNGFVEITTGDARINRWGQK